MNTSLIKKDFTHDKIDLMFGDYAGVLCSAIPCGARTVDHHLFVNRILIKDIGFVVRFYTTRTDSMIWVVIRKPMRTNGTISSRLSMHRAVLERHWSCLRVLTHSLCESNARTPRWNNTVEDRVLRPWKGGGLQRERRLSDPLACARGLLLRSSEWRLGEAKQEKQQHCKGY